MSAPPVLTSMSLLVILAAAAVWSADDASVPLRRLNDAGVRLQELRDRFTGDRPAGAWSEFEPNDDRPMPPHSASSLNAIQPALMMSANERACGAGTTSRNR